MKATVTGVGSVLGSFDLEGLDHFVTHVQGASNLAGVLDLGLGDSPGTARDGEDLLGPESLAGDREQRGAVDPSRQGDENCAVLTQQRNRTLFFPNCADRSVHLRSRPAIQRGRN